MFRAIRSAMLGLATALCAMAISPRAADATVIYTLSGDDPTIGGLLSAVFSADTFIILPDPPASIPLPNLTTCIVAGATCTSASLMRGSRDETLITLGLITSHFLDSSFGSFGTYTSLNGARLVTLTVADAGPPGIPEPASLTLMAMGLAGLGMMLHKQRA